MILFVQSISELLVEKFLELNILAVVSYGNINICVILLINLTAMMEMLEI
jgi:hypothetical protein